MSFSIGNVSSIALQSISAASHASAVSLNPQPLPPSPCRDGLQARLLSPGDNVSINPQPLPPREAMASTASLAQSLHAAIAGLAGRI